MTSMCFDYVARQKVGGTHLTYSYLNQMPSLASEEYNDPTPWHLSQTLSAWLADRVVELAYTAWDMSAFATQMGINGAPFRWVNDRRVVLRAELDAAYLHLYGLDRDEVEHVLTTFPIVRRKDEAGYGEFAPTDWCWRRTTRWPQPSPLGSTTTRRSRLRPVLARVIR